jgi:hypothetical protein
MKGQLLFIRNDKIDLNITFEQYKARILINASMFISEKSTL